MGFLLATSPSFGAISEFVRPNHPGLSTTGVCGNMNRRPPERAPFLSGFAAHFRCPIFRTALSLGVAWRFPSASRLALRQQTPALLQQRRWYSGPGAGIVNHSIYAAGSGPTGGVFSIYCIANFRLRSTVAGLRESDPNTERFWGRAFVASDLSGIEYVGAPGLPMQIRT